MAKGWVPRIGAKAQNTQIIRNNANTGQHEAKKVQVITNTKAQCHAKARTDKGVSSSSGVVLSTTISQENIFSLRHDWSGTILMVAERHSRQHGEAASLYLTLRTDRPKRPCTLVCWDVAETNRTTTSQENTKHRRFAQKHLVRTSGIRPTRPGNVQ